jgi:hypothetical protein
MRNKCLIGKDLEGNIRNLIDVLSWDLSGELRETTAETQRDGIRIG